MARADPTLRIGELARRVGLSPELLRAWERRYGLLDPARTPGGFRLYSGDDERRVRLMQEQLARGLSAAEAAALALAEADAPAGLAAGGGHGVDAGELRGALDALDEERAQAALDRLLSTFTLETVLADAVLPYLRDLGSRWERGEATVAQEHFASHLLRGRLLGLARGWDRGAGPRALLACAPGELHDLPLVAFGLALRGHGWRITFLGADTPIASVEEAAAQLRPELVVLSAVGADRFEGLEPALRALADTHRLALAGPGAGAALAERSGAGLIEDDPVSAARRIAERR